MKSSLKGQHAWVDCGNIQPMQLMVCPRQEQVCDMVHSWHSAEIPFSAQADSKSLIFDRMAAAIAVLLGDVTGCWRKAS